MARLSSLDLASDCGQSVRVVEGLVNAEVALPPKLSTREQIVGADQQSITVKVTTPLGAFSVHNAAGATEVTGIADARVPVVGLVAMKRGVEGAAGGATVAIQRPRFGLHRASRGIHVEGAGLSLVTRYTRDRHYDVWRPDGLVVLRRQGEHLLVNGDATAEEVALALALDFSGMIAASSLLHGLTTP